MKIILYDEGTAEVLDIGGVAQYLALKMRMADVEQRGNPFDANLTRDRVADYARKIAGTKIQTTSQKIVPGEGLLPAEIEYETRRILGRTHAFGVIYDGFHLHRVFHEVIPREEHQRRLVHIWFTNRLFASWDDSNRRYHLRTSLYGMPSIISTTGLIEAPAKAREYYLLKQQYDRLGKDLTGLRDRFRGSFIDYEDARLTEVAKGYAVQAAFYSLIGDPFCQDRGCRLYNAHWQEELIFAQLESDYEFCPRHTTLLEETFSQQ